MQAENAAIRSRLRWPRFLSNQASLWLEHPRSKEGDRPHPLHPASAFSLGGLCTFGGRRRDRSTTADIGFPEGRRLSAGIERCGVNKVAAEAKSTNGRPVGLAA
jgi:hypothetical protein